jgi:tRNA(fMet)-specific endonuclease VapC
MQRLSYLVDTDVLIDWLQGRSWAKALLSAKNARFYCSSVSRKELLDRPGLSGTERKRINRLLQLVRVLTLDPVIAAAASELLQKYHYQPLRVPDALIAATAWIKNFPLITRNRKHYIFIEEITLAARDELPASSV